MNADYKIEVKVFTILELKELVYKGSNIGLTERIISNARALALINNPYAKDSYPSIAVAFENRMPVGYTAVLADELNGEPIFFGTTGFIDVSMRGKGVGTLLYSSMMKACNNRWFASDSAPAALTISRKTGLGIYFYDRYYLNYEHSSSLKSRIRAWQVHRTNNRVLRNLQTQTRLEVLRYIDDQTYAFIIQHDEQNLFHRSQSMFNWILQYPFKACAPTDIATYSQYEFTSSLPQYTIYAFRIILGDKLIGFAMFRLTKGELTLLYIYKDINYTSDVYTALVKHILSQDIMCFRTFDKGLIDYYNQIGAVSMNSKSRTIQVSLSAPADMQLNPSLTIQGGDGDMFC